MLKTLLIPLSAGAALQPSTTGAVRSLESGKRQWADTPASGPGPAEPSVLARGDPCCWTVGAATAHTGHCPSCPPSKDAKARRSITTRRQSLYRAVQASNLESCRHHYVADTIQSDPSPHCSRTSSACAHMRPHWDSSSKRRHRLSDFLSTCLRQSTSSSNSCTLRSAKSHSKGPWRTSPTNK